MAESMIAFGPVPSRRLGRSLGINNIPPKICTYSCVYCQLGRTIRMEVKRRPFYDPVKLAQEVQKKVEEAEKADEHIDFLTFVPDGEPTLDVNLGREIDMLRETGIKIAVITNSSLLWRSDVQEELARADLVSLKVDAVDNETWHHIDRPHQSLKLTEILEGIEDFADMYQGEIITETMLVKGINDKEAQLEETADFLSRINPSTSYISIPIRPPAEEWVETPDETAINMAHRIFTSRIPRSPVKYLIGYEGNEFSFTGDVEQDILSIVSVHPMKREAVEKFLNKAGAGWDDIERLINEEKLVELTYRGEKFYMRRIASRRG